MTLLVFTKTDTQWYGKSQVTVSGNAQMVKTREHVKLMFGKSGVVVTAKARPLPQVIKMKGTSYMSVYATGKPDIVHFYWRKGLADFSIKQAEFRGPSGTDFR
jgi:hypothetical protein